MTGCFKCVDELPRYRKCREFVSSRISLSFSRRILTVHKYNTHTHIYIYIYIYIYRFVAHSVTISC
jgi:hypothetical protein